MSTISESNQRFNKFVSDRQQRVLDLGTFLPFKRKTPKRKRELNIRKSAEKDVIGIRRDRKDLGLAQVKRSGDRQGKPRWLRILVITSDSRMAAMIFQCSTTMRAILNIYIEHPFE